MKEIKDEVLIEIDTDKIPEIISIKKKRDEIILDIKLGLTPISEIKTLLNEINAL
jgi:hypothetical protein